MEVGKAARERGEGDFGLDSGERRTEAVVPPGGEAEVMDVRTPGVEAGRVLEASRVAVRRTGQAAYVVAGWNSDAAGLDVLERAGVVTVHYTRWQNAWRET